MISNELGLTFTAASDAAVQAFDETLAAYAGFRRDTGPRLKATFAADPDMPMAHVLRGLFMQYTGNPAVLPKARESLAAAQVAASKREVNAREQLHIAGLEAWVKGDLDAGIRVYEAILIDFPCDLLALKLSNFFSFYTGNKKNLRDGVARVLPCWSARHPWYGFLLSLYAFGLEENGQYAEAERCGREAVERNPNDAWGVHAVAHVHEMLDRHQQGIEWIESQIANWDVVNNFRHHLWWHLALQYLNRGATGEALRLYDQKIWDPESDEYLDLCNDISMLQRLELYGVDVGGRWQPLADKAEKLGSARNFAFVDAHYLLALAAAGRRDQALAMAEALHEHSRSSALTSAQVSAKMNDALVDGLVAFRAGDHARTVDLLAPQRERIATVGGSDAQRDLFDEILVESALRAGRYRYARGLLAERKALRPENPWNTPRLAQALAALGPSQAHHV